MKTLRLSAVLALLFSAPLQAGQFKVLKTFTDPGQDGAQPAAVGMVVAGGKIYGVTYSGGAAGMGVLYRMNLDGTGFQKLRDFSAAQGRPGDQEGWSGIGKLLLGSGDRILGTTDDGSSGSGSLWSRQIADPELSSELAQFGYSGQLGGDSPRLSFVDGNTIYGFTSWGGGDGNQGKGTVFRIDLDGTNPKTLRIFAGGVEGESVQQVILGDGVIYGITKQGGSVGRGTVFKLNKDGTGFQTLMSFTTPNARPQSIVYLQGKIYGISQYGGISSPAEPYPDGFLFSVNTDGTSYTVLKSFPDEWNSKLLVSDGNLFYITFTWRTSPGLISIRPDGTGQQTLVNFSNSNNGTTGRSTVNLIYSGGRLYGANKEAGASGLGTVWSYDPGNSGDPAPYTGPLYSAVTFGGSLSQVENLPVSTKTSRGNITTVNAQKISTMPLSNALVLDRARQAGIQVPALGYSIVCTDVDELLKFYAYKPGSSLIPLESVIGFTETGALQAVSTTDIYNSVTGISNTSEAGTDKFCGEGVFLGKQVAVNGTVSYKSANAVINGQMSRYYPGTSKGSFFGVNDARTEFVDGTFSIAAPKAIQVPQ